MRKKRTIINILTGVGGQLFTQGLAFVVRTIFIYSLGREYLGINGLFSNILSLLSLAELGIGSAITYYLYKPLSEKNHKKINAYMIFYKKVYTLVGFSVIIIGLLLIPFLGFIMKDMPDVQNINLIYFLFLLNTGVSYFFSYYTTLLVADQKQYKTVLISQIVSLVKTVVQIYVLIVLKDYILYLLIMIVSTVLNNIILAYIARKEYEDVFSSKNEKLTQNDLADLKRYIGATFLHKVGSIIVFNTDNLLISSFVGISYVGITSNYFLILQMLSTFIGQIFHGMIASVGNLNSEMNLENSYKFYKVLDFFVFCFYTICSLNLVNLVNPFVELWIGTDYVLAYSISFLIVFNFYLTGLRRSNLMFIDTMGLQWITRRKPIYESISNLLFSLIFLRIFGLIGVFIGTFFSTVLCSFFYEPVILFKHGFKLSVIPIFTKYAKYFAIASLCYFICNFIISLLSLTGFVQLIWIAGVSTLVPLVILTIVFWNTMEFNYYKNLVFGLIKKKNDK